MLSFFLPLLFQFMQKDQSFYIMNLFLMKEHLNVYFLKNHNQYRADFYESPFKKSQLIITNSKQIFYNHPESYL